MGIWSGFKGVTGDLWRGFRAPFAGFRYMIDNPGTLKYALPPAPIIAALLVGMFYLTWTHSDDLLTWAWAMPEGDAWSTRWLLVPLWYVAWGLVTLATTALGLIAVAIASIPLAGPFMELLSEKVEKLETGFEAPFSFTVMARNILVSLTHATALGLVGATVAITGLALGLIPVVGPVLAMIISLTIAPMLIGLNPFDYPMTIRLWPFRDKVAFVRQNLTLFYGFALCAYLMLYIPLVNLLLLPACVIGATRLLIELQGEGRADFRDRRVEVLQKRGKLAEPEPAPASTSASAEPVAAAQEAPQEVAAEVTAQEGAP